LSGLEIDERPTRRLADRHGGSLANRHDRLAAQQHAGERSLTRVDRVMEEDIVLELERDRSRQRGAPSGDVAFQRGHDADLRRLDGGERRRRRDEGEHRERSTATPLLVLYRSY